MTDEEVIIKLAKDEWAAKMKDIFKDPIFKQQKEKYKRYCREMAAEEKAREREAARAIREAERLRE